MLTTSWLFALVGIERTLVEVEYVLHPGDELVVELADAPHFFPATA